MVTEPPGRWMVMEPSGGTAAITGLPYDPSYRASVADLLTEVA